MTSNITAAECTLRYAQAGDREAIIRLAQLDSQPEPSGPLLVAESEGRVVAALPLEADDAIANPFVRTAELVEILRLWAARLSSESNGRRGGLRRRASQVFRPAPSGLQPEHERVARISPVWATGDVAG